MTAENFTSDNLKDSKINDWFTEMVATLRVDQQKMIIGAIEPEKRKFYESAMIGNLENLVVENTKMVSRMLIGKILHEYMGELLEERKAEPLKLAFDLSNNKILVWAEINDNDEATEDALILSEAKINANYHDLGFNISSTIVESMDSIPTPTHYQEVIIK